MVGALALAGALAFWELICRRGWVDQQFLSPPSKVAPTLVELVRSGELRPHVQATLARLAAGCAIGIPLGIGLGILVAYVKLIDWAVSPLVELVRAVPPLALLPVFLLFFGLGFAFPVSIIAWVAWVPVFLSTVEGIRKVDKEIVEAAMVDGARTHQIARKVALPVAAPFILVGVRLAIGAGFLVVVAAELMGVPQGLGFYILEASQTFRVPEMYAAIVVFGALAFGSNAIVVALAWLLVPTTRSEPAASSRTIREWRRPFGSHSSGRLSSPMRCRAARRRSSAARSTSG